MLKHVETCFLLKPVGFQTSAVKLQVKKQANLCQVVAQGSARTMFAACWSSLLMPLTSRNRKSSGNKPNVHELELEFELCCNP